MLSKERREGLEAINETYTSIYGEPANAPPKAQKAWRRALDRLDRDNEQRAAREARRREKRQAEGKQWYS